MSNFTPHTGLFEELSQGLHSSTLGERFLLPPFTILNAREGWWQDRKRAWLELGIRPAAGRDDMRSTSLRVDPNDPKYDYIAGRGDSEGGSSFDPVLAELVCRWFCQPGGLVIDPFAGESSKGIVTAATGRRYVGVELRQGQVDANRAQWKKVAPQLPDAKEPLWVQGDGRRTDILTVTYGLADLVFTSPPYYDIEVYSGDAADGSAMGTYEEFMQLYRDVFTSAVKCLGDNRFLVVKVGDIRNKKTGAYRGFVAHNINVFQELGLHLYNDAVLLTPMGSLPVKASRAFAAGRKLGKAHQNVLIFYKGDTRHVADHHRWDAPTGNSQ